MKDLLYEFPLDAPLTTDEWDHILYLIEEDLRGLEVPGKINRENFPLPFIAYFEDKAKQRLIDAGFKKKIVEDQKELEKILKVLDEQGIRHRNWRWDLNPPYGLPIGSFTVGEDNHIMWVKPHIEAALRALISIVIIKELLVNDGVVNKGAVRVYLRSFELIMNLSRAGNTPGLAISEEKKRLMSLETRDLKKLVMRCIIENIFKKNPDRPKTLGEVWNKINRGYGGIYFEKTKKKYIAKTGKNAKGKDIVIITGDAVKPFEYVK